MGPVPRFQAILLRSATARGHFGAIEATPWEKYRPIGSQPPLRKPNGVCHHTRMTTFYKAHGLGNDFVILRAQDVSTIALDRLAVFLCDRHRGIGADGILILNLDDASADVNMRVLNSDGSEPEMCGNGIRCAVKICVEKYGITTNPLTVSTRAGVMTCAWEMGDNQVVQSVSVNMGYATIGPNLAETIAFANTEIALAVDMGNPHVVLFGEFPLDTIRELGPKIQTLPVFSAGVNVNFAALTSDATGRSGKEIQLTVYERGAGLTLACGTGACATAAAAVYAGWAQVGQPITVALPGGKLLIETGRGLAPVTNRFPVTMTGPAEIVFQGTLSNSLLAG